MTKVLYVVISFGLESKNQLIPDMPVYYVHIMNIYVLTYIHTLTRQFVRRKGRRRSEIDRYIDR